MTKVIRFLLVRVRFVLPVVAFVAACAGGGMAADKPGWMPPARKFAQTRARVSGGGEPQHDIQSLRQRAETGDAFAQNALGFSYVSGEGIPEDKAKAVKWFRRAAEQGNAAGQHNLGIAYYTGVGVPEDKAEAVKWLRCAAEQGHALAQANYGVAYVHGHGVSQNYEEAVKWFRLSAERGGAAGQHNLGGMYCNGTGVTQDYREAYVWLSLAAANGLKIAVEPRDQVADKLPPVELLAAQKEAAKRNAEIRQKMAQGGKGA